MSGDFIDSNVFVYLFDKSDPSKLQIAQRVVLQTLASGTGAISYQMVRLISDFPLGSSACGEP